tara:strand:+ start:2390 stop:3088 length:699 start_codon:yes stop_codon:yes gene_type:complete
MSNYTIQVAWSGKDALADSDVNKVISGTDFDTEFTAIRDSVNSKAELAGSATQAFSATTAASGTNTTQVATTAFVQAATPTAAVINALVYPVGSIYTAVVATNPATLLGVGTWVAFGSGKTLVGLDSGDTAFDTVEETGGAKTHTLTEAEIPSHDHKLFSDEIVAPSYTTSNVTASTSVSKQTTGSHSAAEGYITRAGTVDATVGLSSDTGGGTAHNNLQPYIVVYFWKRTA